METDRGVVKISACPHDCPSGCSLEVTVLDGERIGRISGAKQQSYTSGVICAKVARYAERVHHPDRLLRPLRRVGVKGEGRFEPVSWQTALDEIAEAFARATDRHGPEAVWPYHSGGTMGLVQRYGMDGFRHALGYSRQHSSICMTPAESGWRAGVGALRGSDPREMVDADLIIVWGANPVSTQVNVMTHVTQARRSRGAKLAVVDVYRTPTVEQADIALIINPGTDGALALAIMHVLLRDGFADRDYLAHYTDFDARSSASLPPARRHGQPPSPASTSRRSSTSRTSMAGPAGASCERASASRGHATDRPRCMPSPACRRSRGRGRNGAAAPIS